MPGARPDFSALPRLAFVPASLSSTQSDMLAAATKKDHRSDKCRGNRGTAQDTQYPVVTELPAPDALVYPAVTRHGPGLNNVGNSCYANATLQALLHNPAIVYIVSNHKSWAHQRPSSRNFCALCALKDLARRLHGLSVTSNGHGGEAKHGSEQVRTTPITPSMFVDPSSLRQISRTFRHSRQEDAHEFLRGLLDSAIRSSLLGCGAPMPTTGAVPLSREQEMRSVVHAACGGILQSGVRCHSCGYESITLEPFLDLSIGTASTIERALSRFTASDRLDGHNMYRCESCSKKVVASKRLTIRTAPNSLTIHLKRFDGYRKDRSDVKYGSKLDLAPYMVSPPPSSSLWYHLVGVLVHDGAGTRSGHYYSYVKGSNGTWCVKNDSLSSTVPESRALRQQAYILFFSRDATSGQTRNTNKNVQQNEACDAQQSNLKSNDRVEVRRASSLNMHEKGSSVFENRRNTARGSSESPLAKLNGLNQSKLHVITKPMDPPGDSSFGEDCSGTDPDSSGQEVGYECQARYANQALVVKGVNAAQKQKACLTPKRSAAANGVPEDRSVANAIGSASDMKKLSYVPASPDPPVSVPKGSVLAAITHFESISNSPSSDEVSESDEPNDLVASYRDGSSVRSTPSGASTLNSDSSRDKSVRAFIAGSGRAVRKFAQRLFNYVGTTPESRNGSDGRSSPVVAGFSTIVENSTSGNADETLRGTRRRENESEQTPTERKALFSKSSTGTTSRPKSPSSEASGSSGSKLKSRGSPASKSSRLFHDQGVDAWDTASNAHSSEGIGKISTRMLPKRARARDALDADYDRGKPKKIKRSRTGSGGLRENVFKINPFQAAADRRKAASSS